MCQEQKRGMSLPRWIPDSSVTTCFNCRVTFGLFYRKHHCRICGHVFCGTCTGHRTSIPFTLLQAETPPTVWGSVVNRMFAPSQNPTTVGSPMNIAPTSIVAESIHRVCEPCKQRVFKARKVEHLTEIIILLGQHAQICLPEWKRMVFVSKQWNSAVAPFIKGWLSIQHVAPYKQTTGFQRILLSMNAHLISPRHLAWPILAARSGIKQQGQLHVPCATLGCSVICKRAPSCARAIVALVLGERDMAVRILRQKHDFYDTLSCFTNLLAAATVFDKYLLAEIIVPICLKNFRFSMMLYFNIRARDATLARALYGHLPPSYISAIDDTSAFIEALIAVAQNETAIRINPSRLPSCPDIEVLSILHENVRKKASSSKPKIVPCICRRYGEKRTFIQCFMVKNEDLRSDACIIDAMRLLAVCIKKDMNRPIAHLTYDVTCVSQNVGIVTMVSGASTLYAIRQSDTSLQNFVYENNSNISVDEVKTRFLESCAFSTTASLLFGFGDRHLDNIMISRTGHMFHCDFSHVLNREPGVKAITGNNFRITPQMIDFLGGRQSQFFKKFRTTCIEVFNTARRWYLLFYSVLHALVYDKMCKMQHLIDTVENVFAPGSHLDIKVLIEDRIDRESSGAPSWKDTLTDGFHHLFRMS